MSASDWIAFGQLVLSVVVAGLAVLGYFKLIRSTDENAKERRAEIERNAKERQQAIEDVGAHTSTAVEHVTASLARRERIVMLAIGGLLLWMLAIYSRTLWRLHDMDKKINALREDTERIR
jgi:hypothetical protein